MTVQKSRDEHADAPASDESCRLCNAVCEHWLYPSEKLSGGTEVEPRYCTECERAWDMYHGEIEGWTPPTAKAE